MPDSPSRSRLVAFLLSIAAGTTLHAADFHVSPFGEGSKDGSSPENAARASYATVLFNLKMQAGDRLIFAPGDYWDFEVKFSNGGTEEQPKTVIAAPGTVFRARWKQREPDKGTTAIILGTGLSHVVFRDLTIRHYQHGIMAGPSPETPRVGLMFDNVDMDHIRHGFYLSDCDDLVLRDCDLKRYSKHGFRFERGCDRVRVTRCTADCSEGDTLWETGTENFTFGFILNDQGAANTGFVFEDCLATNNMKSNQNVRYTNGDGFVAEGNSRDVTFIRCRALRNQDGGFDLKTSGLKLIDCIAIDHRRDFRIWKHATLKNCLGGWSEVGVWTKNGAVVLENCTFLRHGKASIETDELSAGPPETKNCILELGTAKEGASIGPSKDSGSIVAKTPEQAGLSIRNLEPTYNKPAWNGEGAALDSTAHPEMGYSSKRVTQR